MQDYNVRHKIKDLDIKTQLHEQNLIKNANTIEEGALRIVQRRIQNHLLRLDGELKRGAISQQTYDRELTKARWANEEAKTQLTHEVRRGAEYINNARPGREQTADMFKLADTFTGALKMFK